jgi:hypothetical protein
MENKISKEFLFKLRYFFAFPRILLFVAAFLLIYSLLNYYNFLSFFFPWRLSLIFSILLLIISIPKYFIAEKVRRALIYKIQQESDTIILTTYDKSIVSINKNLIPLQKEPRDYFINTLFSSRTGTIQISPNENETCVIEINKKRFYLVPNIFEAEVAI